MSIRTFIFCDSCNPQGIRTINNRCTNSIALPTSIKTERRSNYGRRNTDGCSWHEGSIRKSLDLGWVNLIEDGENRMLCPQCNQEDMAELLEKSA